MGERSTDQPAFVVLTSPDGSGWVPARYIEAERQKGTVRVPYDTTGIPAVEGESVEVIRDDPKSGWSWCRNAEGREPDPP